MTKMEIATLFGWTCDTLVRQAFSKAAKDCESIRKKKGQGGRNCSIDYTLEEALIALPNIKHWNPVMQRFLIENFIHRDNTFVPLPKKLNYHQLGFIFLYDNHRHPTVCANCTYMIAKSFNTVYSKQYPFCTFYNVFLNKAKPTRNIYKDCCSTYRETKSNPLIFTKTGVFPRNQIKLDGSYYSIEKDVTNNMLGISSSEFKSKRQKGEPITILKDIFSDGSDSE